MSDKFTIEIITPDKTILKSEATEVTIPSFEGQMGILKDHIPLITFLRPGLILVQNQEKKKYFVKEGTVEFSDNNLLILTSTVKDLKNIKKNISPKHYWKDEETTWENIGWSEFVTSTSKLVNWS